MARTTATSIVLLSVLVAGIVAPTGLCALMCQRHVRAETQRHCSEPSDAMSGMAHDHSAMHHPAIEMMSLVMMSPSCQPNCVAAARLNVSRKIVAQAKVIETSPVVLDTTAGLVADLTAAWDLDSGPPAPAPASAVSFSILRI